MLRSLLFSVNGGIMNVSSLIIPIKQVDSKCQAVINSIDCLIFDWNFE